MENQIAFQHSGLTFLIIAHVVVAIIGLILSHVGEKSIITDRKNKYIFFILSLMYSLVFPQIVISALLNLHLTWGVSSTVFRLCTWGSFVIYVLLQMLVYRVLNRIEED
ncbi:hypothetical protein [Halobacillus aidingensis]|uniref:Uncharacterized protein n=1 Tax=Halobacillus aidingensis TaxID=240303 RepID=A0A1H0UD43_HALAD|nr:hypothetical protein [Halobacillus aidingensis]SDP63776.1 hypothetical protein SAMN05421677_12535 [Halobacillus aidingensis]